MYKEKARGDDLGLSCFYKGREKLQLFTNSSGYLRELIGREF